MNAAALSSEFAVRSLTAEDIEQIYAVCCQNTLFYQYHPPFVTQESIQADMAALPPAKERKDKYYLGFFAGETLVAIMDLILDYPAEKIAFIGFFMMNTAYQRQGIGSKIIADCARSLRSFGFHKIRLGTDKGNPESNAFWRKNGFVAVSEGAYILMELDLKDGKEI